MSSKIRNFTDLDAWKQGHGLVLLIYSVTKHFPKEQTYILVNQMLRAALSMTSNIAEGFSRQTKKEKQQFYFIAKGPLTELENQVIVAKDLSFISAEMFQKLNSQIIRVSTLINGLIKSCESIPNTRYDIRNTFAKGGES